MNFVHENPRDNSHQKYLSYKWCFLVRRKLHQSKIFPTKMTTFASFPMSNIRFMITITIKQITNMKTNHFLRLKLFWCIDKN